ncbi:hypothetical protein [Gemmata sp.]|uniref:hypothetical protein n=1 Tax=Gemmata sp. TaxID=1914242 RepID=UPI003F6E4F20
MFATLARVRVLVAALALAVAAAPAAAAPVPSSLATRTTEAAHTDAAADAPPAGSPELGVLLIIGVVAVLIFMAWLLSRVGDESSGTDGTMV